MMKPPVNPDYRLPVNLVKSYESKIVQNLTGQFLIRNHCLLKIYVYKPSGIERFQLIVVFSFELLKFRIVL